MGAGTGGKSKARRKKRISKHVKDAEERRKNKDESVEGDAPSEKSGDNKDQSQQKSKSNSSKKNKHIKDPAEAASYLSSWKHREAGSGWKFNKNTQSWLIRHMYETNKVPKATFTVLMEYLLGVKGITRTRLREEAARRALRYKEHEKKSKAEGDNDKNEEEVDDAKKGESKESKESSDDTESDEARWAKLDDHDKRKEYKRARKVLDSIKEEAE